MKNRAAHHRVCLSQEPRQLIRASHQLEPGRPAELGSSPDPEQAGPERCEAAGECGSDCAEADDQDSRVEQRPADRPVRPAALGKRRPGLI
jgi:hypothetical protein